MEDPIDHIAEELGEAPRRFSLWTRIGYLRIAKPRWLESTDKLGAFFNKLPGVWENGILTWGHVIQANALMWAKRTENCPGEVVYTTSTDRRIPVPELASIAAACAALKNTSPRDPDEARIADYLTDEFIRTYGMKVPGSISPEFKCRISTTFFARKHLPDGRLCCPLIPILVNPAKPRVVVTVPGRFWPDDFVRWWTRNGARG